jgi:glucose-6-phosphate isomerase
MDINSFKPLSQNYLDIKNKKIKDLLEDSKRKEILTIKLFDELYLDLTKNLINKDTISAFVSLAKELEIEKKIKQNLSGDIVNFTEKRAVMHTALRNPNLKTLIINNKDYASEVINEKLKMDNFVKGVRNGEIKTYFSEKFEYIVNIGIGGSYLSIKMAYNALKDQDDTNIKVFFVSNIDASNLKDILKQIDAKKTLFIVASKTFTTQETIVNADTIKNWFINQVGEEAVKDHFVALSTNITEVKNFGIKEEFIFGFWDFIGGRYSIWSVIGLSLAIKIGVDKFNDFLKGANMIDEYLLSTPLEQNAIFLLASIGIWYNNFFNYNAYAIIAYDYRLEDFTPYIQQLEMESNGKSVNNKGEFINYKTSPIVFGEVGTDSQHSFFQAIHQGTQVIPCDFIAFAKPNHTYNSHHDILIANMFAQSDALMLGKSITEVEIELQNVKLNSEQIKNIAPHKTFQGNRPSNIFLFKELNAKTLGMLCAIYEHKILIQGLLWQINSFDQFGVELGKVLAKDILKQIQNNSISTNPSTNDLIKWFNIAKQ